MVVLKLAMNWPPGISLFLYCGTNSTHGRILKLEAACATAKAEDEGTFISFWFNFFVFHTVGVLAYLDDYSNVWR
jgi:hypothetical protein